MVILKIAFKIPEPPVLATKAPKIIKKTIVELYNQYSIPLTGTKRVAKSGKTPPNVKAKPDANAA